MQRLQLYLSKIFCRFRIFTLDHNYVSLRNQLFRPLVDSKLSLAMKILQRYWPTGTAVSENHALSWDVFFLNATDPDQLMSVEIHPLTANPTAAWRELSKTQKVAKINVSVPKNEVPQHMVRFVCMSDTHSLTSHVKFDVPDGDVFIHAGDFTRCGGEEEVVNFSNWIGKLPHKYKIVIAGNHELSFDPTFTHPLTNKLPFREGYVVDEIPTLGIPREHMKEAVENTNIRDKLTNCIYLEDDSTTVYGVKIYGTPWQPEFCKWAFNLPRGEPCLLKWNKIPDDIDILVTHTPPLGHGDLCCTGVRAGCVELLSTVQRRVLPKYHVFGHVHEGYGVSSDGKIIYINASTCNINYLPVNPPIVFDIPLRPGLTKNDC